MSYYHFILFCLELNQRIFVYDDDEWMIKGRYETAVEDNEDLTWTYENGQDLVRILIVKFYFNFELKLIDIIYRLMMVIKDQLLVPSLHMGLLSHMVLFYAHISSLLLR